MGIKVSGTPFDKHIPNVKKTLDQALANTLFVQQGRLNKQPPFEDGRMASSWQIGHNTPPEPADRGENWKSDKGERWEYEGQITFDGNWFISNNVPYAQPVCLLGGYPPSWDGLPASIPQGWYTEIANDTGRVFKEQFRNLS